MCWSAGPRGLRHPPGALVCPCSGTGEKGCRVIILVLGVSWAQSPRDRAGEGTGRMEEVATQTHCATTACRVSNRGGDHRYHPALFMGRRQHEWRSGASNPLKCFRLCILVPPVFKGLSEHISIMKHTRASSLLRQIAAEESRLLRRNSDCCRGIRGLHPN